MLLDFYCTLVDLGDPVRSRGFDDFAGRLGMPFGPGELYRRYVEMISSEPEEHDLLAMRRQLCAVGWPAQREATGEPVTQEYCGGLSPGVESIKTIDVIVSNELERSWRR